MAGRSNDVLALDNVIVASVAVKRQIKAGDFSCPLAAADTVSCGRT